jgi:hypothetical protein
MAEQRVETMIEGEAQLALSLQAKFLGGSEPRPGQVPAGSRLQDCYPCAERVRRWASSRAYRVARIG